MREFNFQRGSGPWHEGETLLHVYALPDLDRDRGLAELIHGCREAVTGYPLTHVADEFLHITIAQFPDAPASDYSPSERAELTHALQVGLDRLDPFEIQVGSCLSYHSGVIFDLHPDDKLAELVEVVTRAAGGVRGPAAARYDVGVPHLTLAYASGAADSDEIQRRIRRVRPSHAAMTISSVHLLDVASDPQAKTITWSEPVAELHLGGGADQ